MIEEYFKLKNQIHEYFGYKGDWVEIPMEDDREYYWYFDGFELRYSPNKEDLINDNDENIYSGTLYQQRFLDKWVYEAKDMTMISIDTHVDGNKFLMILDNEKKVPV